ncbi:hypothetical protein BDV26DRAFT_262128 [Aspergillus bertholletiae]|uniref:HNH nuclease domain-containing protein n=1 Tax=Aspergillus bertholletiae TaxID=1226010 RepID=A0A5N7B8T0_9EURO|nr:hypothetical protein BDV26DRAFT_262128 [Aspergillus bertholletiae]
MSTPSTQQPPTCTSDSAGPAHALLNQERRDLIARLLQTIGEPLVTSIAWACLWFADLESIKDLIRQCELSETTRRLMVCGLHSQDITDVIKAWGVRFKNARDAAQVDEDSNGSDEDLEEIETPMKKRQRLSKSQKSSRIPKQKGKPADKRPSEATPATMTRTITVAASVSPKKRTNRKAAVKKLCFERDKDACVITGFCEPLEAAHIYPYSLSNKGEKGQQIFWDTLKIFWSPEMVATWEKQVLGPDGTETCSNRICMVNIAHKLWEKARFALKPLSLSEDQSTLTVQFFWLPTNQYRPAMPSTEAPSPFPDNVSSSIVNGKDSAILFNVIMDKKVCSGDILTFETSDPVGHPLPSVELLNMQWTLHRVLALSGAADATDEEFDPYSDVGPEGFTRFGVDLEEEEEEEESDEGEGEEMVVEASRLGGRASIRTDENLPPGDRRRPTLPRLKDIHHKGEEGEMREEERADEESSPFTLPFRNINIR